LWGQLHDSPRKITVAGNAACLTQRSLAIVGTRKASARGLAVATSLASELSRHGWIIVSGLAQGIDGAAHHGSLEAGGITVAIMGTGIDRTYPTMHRGLRRRIEASGCVVTEFPVGAGPTKWSFPRRNRLIAGMAEGVIVVDAPARSGALLTAYLASDLGREVFAVPGPVDSRRSRGCHHLIREGATLVESVEDIHLVLPPPCLSPEPTAAVKRRLARIIPAPGSAARWIWDRVDLEGTSLHELQERWVGGSASWAEGLVALEMAGLIRRLAGGRIARRYWEEDSDPDAG
jgi:DNA processing protein